MRFDHENLKKRKRDFFINCTQWTISINFTNKLKKLARLTNEEMQWLKNQMPKTTTNKMGDFYIVYHKVLNSTPAVHSEWVTINIGTFKNILYNPKLNDKLKIWNMQ